MEWGLEWWLIAGGLVLLYLLSIRKRLSPGVSTDLPAPRYEERLHRYTEHAVQEGRKIRGRILELNAGHLDQEAVHEFADLNEEYARQLTMYFDARQSGRSREVQLYWATWSRDSQRREEAMRFAHDLAPYEMSEVGGDSSAQGGSGD